MKTRSIAYMAGLMDTDGTLGIYDKGDSGYQATVEFCNDDLQLIKWVVTTFGGTYRAKPDKRRTAIGYIWRTQGKQHSSKILDQLIPFLVLKKKEAQIIKEFLSIEGENPELRKSLMIQCRLEKGKRSIVETDTLRSLFEQKPNIVHAYVAGLIDGDGNIDTYENQVVIGFTNMCVSLIDNLMSLFGGGKYQCKPTTWRWQLAGTRNQELFLLKTLPYLRVKYKRGKTALNFVRVKLNKVKTMGRPFNKLMIQPELIGDNESGSSGN